MNYAIHRISLDINDDSPSQLTLSARQGDTAKLLIITLLADKHNYQIEKGCYATFTGKKSSGAPFEHECVINRETNKIEYTFVPMTVSTSGNIDCEINIFNGYGERLTTARFNIVVYETVFSGSVSDKEEDVTAATQLRAELNKLIDDVETKLENGEFKGEQGATGAKIVSLVLQGQDENGGNVYLMTFDDGTTATFTAPKGKDGQGGGTSVDVQINGTSIVENGIANIPVASDSMFGVGKVSAYRGIRMTSEGLFSVEPATEKEITEQTQPYHPIVPKTLGKAIKIGITTNTNELTEEEKASAQAWLGISSGTQLYKHELIINKTNDSYKELVFISTQSTAFTNVQTALESIFESDLEGLVKGYSYNTSVDIDGETYYKPMEIYIDFTKSIGSPPFDFCTTLEGGNDEKKFTDLSTIFPFDATIEEYTPIPLQGE